MIETLQPDRKYLRLWQKYRPVILKLMVTSADGPQQYNLSMHEFYDINTKKKSGYAFSLQVYKSKAVNNIKSSVIAQDLLYVLQNSKTAVELMEESTYEFELDKSFKFYVTRKDI
ncbi:MAG: hypothetical protein AAFX87_26375 [Bacteroidota bacterium]